MMTHTDRRRAVNMLVRAIANPKDPEVQSYLDEQRARLSELERSNPTLSKKGN